MRAAVMRNKQLVVDEIADPVPQSGQVLVRTLACGICGSDLHTLQHGEQMVELSKESGAPFVMDLSRDVVMGHEFSAEVVEIGPDAGDNLRPGDVVVSMPVVIGPSGVQGIGYSNDYPGGYSELMVLSSMLTMKVPNGLSFEHAALTEPMAVGRHAVNRSAIAKGSTAIVLGCGPVGLAVIADLRLKGIAPIVAADFSPARRSLAETMGAHVVVDPREQPAIDAWREATGGMKQLVIFEAVGVPGMIDQAMSAAPRGTKILVVGVCMENDPIRPMLGIAKELDVSFALGYDPMEFGGTLRSIAEGELDVAPLITGRVDLDGVPTAFRDLSNPEVHCKILVEP
ncbi:MAG TPA: zinc-binding dehydrogenase [Acidimicrobiales bacterium]|jgi:threonine dehydrogenase-like Zn-dependent dehydrogenase|nr:zinc-binding dehydrogenase [Acidimicrobiales bacterium]